MEEPLVIHFSEFDEYLKHPDAEIRERAGNWSIAIGLQQVDLLTVSPFLIEVARKNILGEITMEEACKMVRNHYHKR